MILKIYADTKSRAHCRSENCGAAITWAKIATSGKNHPFDGEIVPVRSTIVDGRIVEEIDTDVTTSHFATCPDADRFRK